MSRVLENGISAIEASQPAPIPLSAFFRRVGALACETGNPAYATNIALQEANVFLDVTGDDLTRYADTGLLVISDHRQGGEGWLGMASMHHMGRTDTHMLGKPYAPTGRIVHSMGEPMASLLLPVIPGTMDAGKKGLKAVNEDVIFRVLSPSAVLPREQRNAINQATLQRSASIVAGDGTVLVTPTGSLSDASKAPWQRGVGDIVRLIPEDARHEVHLALVRPGDFPKLKFMAALALRQFGLRLRSQTITMQVVDAGTPIELFGSLDFHDPASGEQIAEQLREEYLKHFNQV
ncbi:MAG: hypothetical protein ACREBW_04975 [Candidatus Micrarchaeaceae archaeon]